MGFEPNGSGSCTPGDQRLHVFALVIYIPSPLGQFLDDLRRELAPTYNPHAHVSVLPPRQITVDWRTASNQAQAIAESWRPFQVDLTDVAIFPVTNVIYLEVGKGSRDLNEMHRRMNSGGLAFDEPYAYHPHTTLAQEIPAGDVAEAAELARRRWLEFRGPRSFQADHAVFVESTKLNCWNDLAEYSLGQLAGRLR
jgi:2'-5' RNA ligase